MYSLKALITLALAACSTAVPLTSRSGDKASSKGYSLRGVGAPNTEDWRIWLLEHDNPISFWHDVPLYPHKFDKQIINFVVEIPRWTNGKIELKRDEPLNPIFHDTNDDGVRFVENVWPHKSYPFLYGSIPQTWESPNFEHPFTGLIGDNDPMDLFDIGQNPGYAGQIKQVKVLGGLALNDGNETDWKIIAIDVNDPIAELLNSYEDVEAYRPGLTQAFHDWFLYYKVARGDGVLEIVGGDYQNASYSVDIVEESHGYWQELIAGEVDSNEINYNQTSQPDLESYVATKETLEAFEVPEEENVLPAEPTPEEYDWWVFLNEDFELIAQE